MTPALDSCVEVVRGRAQAASRPEKCHACGSPSIQQDADVLDTWFSSALWPFSTLGWPDDTPDLRTYYPTSLLISGYEILFFWDARMIMMGLKLMPRPKIEERIPFRALYLHAIVRDPEGIKMSKTRGNVIDPLEIIEKHGTDALRFTLMIMAAPGTDIALSEERILSYRAFANKIWNAARFLFVNLAKFEAAGGKLEDVASPEIRAAAPYALRGEAALVDRWIFSRLARVTAEVNEALTEYRFHEAAHAVYHFFWGDFCDWYIEWVKPRLSSTNREAAITAWRNIFAAFEAALRLLHPFMPFLTEELWHRLPQRAGTKSISLEQFPAPPADWVDPNVERGFDMLQKIVTGVRNIRAQRKLDSGRKIPAELSVFTEETRSFVDKHLADVIRLAGLSELAISLGHHEVISGLPGVQPSYNLAVRHAVLVDAAAEVSKLRKEIERLGKDIESKKSRLSDDAFRSKAPEKIVRGMEQTLREREAELQKVSERLAELEGSAGAASPD